MTTDDLAKLSERLDQAKFLNQLICDLEMAMKVATDNRWKENIRFRVQYFRDGHGGDSVPFGVLGRDFVRAILATELAAARELFAQMEGE